MSLECGIFLHILVPREVHEDSREQAIRCIKKNRQAVGGFSE